jgi:metal iron transporter
MPHSLYLGSGMVQSRLRDYDVRSGLLPPAGPVFSSSTTEQNEQSKIVYKPSLAAVQYSMKYSIAELAVSLFTFALFVNSAILVVAGASLYQSAGAEDADIFSIHDLLSQNLAPAAGTIFALALLLSGVSAGIVCTIAGQMVSEGALDWRMQPWLRRLITRSISITPSIIIAGAVGRSGLDTALNASQVVLSIVLPFVAAPLIWFTSLNRYMNLRRGDDASLADPPVVRGSRAPSVHMRTEPILTSRFGHAIEEVENTVIKMRNGWFVTACAVLVWLVITAMNVANVVLLALGQA